MALFSRRTAPTAPSAPVAVPTRSPAPGGAPQRDEGKLVAIGADMLRIARGHKSGLLSRQFWSDKLMDWSMKDPAFKVQLFRFVDAFPMLTTPEAIHDHLVDYLSQPGVTPPPGFDLGLKAGGLAKKMFAGTISSQIKSMASKFIAGTDAHSALPHLKKYWDDGVAFSVDLLGEACVSDVEADAYRDKYLDLVGNLPAEVASWKPNERMERDHLGVVPRVNVSVKISALSARCDPIDTDGGIRDVMKRLVPILELARDKGVFVNFDMEQFTLKDLTLELFERCCEQVDFQAGLAMQAYLRSGEDDARRICDWAKRAGRQVTVRLVKGAYWDYETIHSEQMGWPSPVWLTKRETDACFERMTEIFLDATPRRSSDEATQRRGDGGVDSAAGSPGVKLALGSHNVRSIAAALEGLERRGLPKSAIELQMLHGMADQLKGAAAEMGLRVREYVPVGEMIPGMAYLVRRLLENTSNESWLRAGFLEDASVEQLLASPHKPNISSSAPPPPSPGSAGEGRVRAPQPPTSPQSLPSSSSDSPRRTLPPPTVSPPERHQLTPAVPGVGDNRPFFNEPFRQFHRREVREQFAKAIAGATVPRIANDRTPADAAEAVRRAEAFFPTWRDTDQRARAAVLTKAAAIMRERRDGLSGVIIRENGKGWREADADVCEAIDFCEYYARVAVPLFEPQRLGRFIGELDQTWHQPRGVAAVISPWNFPIAICAGMTTAALVTGNTVIVKPAEQTPAIASILCDILYEAGCPREALHFLPGVGETTGAALVRDPRIAVIAFTGSMAVGLDIMHAAAPKSPFACEPAAQAKDSSSSPSSNPSPSAPIAHSPLPIPLHIKRVICEMGGKNAIIVDASADLDEAVIGVRNSAFGFQGQKCSACSRVIVVESAYDTFVSRLVESTKALGIGDPLKPGTDIGPVIDEEAAAKIRTYIALGQKEAPLVLGDAACEPEAQAKDSPDPTPSSLRRSVAPSLPNTPSVAPSLRRFVAPQIFSPVPPTARIATEEIFGPVLCVIKAKDFDEALRIANASAYKLTGGVYSRKPSHLERARREFRVGNLYLNRGITGALVARQPFGGFGMSGVGSKAGGAEYLLQFVEPRVCTENTMRRGFAPEL